MLNVKHVIMRDKAEKIIMDVLEGYHIDDAVDKLCDLHNVSHQRELLIDFFMWTDDSIGKAYVGRLVDKYIESINCG